MNLKEQQYICTIAECGSITRAAEKLFITQPALSLYVNNIERVLDVKLFDRTDKQFLLTAAGELYVEKARRMLELQSEFEAGLSDLKNHVDGEFSIGVQLRRAPLLLPPVMMRFFREYPNIRIKVREGVKEELERFLNENQIQLLVYNAESPREDLVSARLYRDRPLLAVPCGHRLNSLAEERAGEKYPRLDLKLCAGEFFIVPTKRQSLRCYVDRVFAEKHLYMGNYMEIRNFETAMQLVNEGYGLGFNREQYRKTMTYLRNIRYYSFTDDSAERNCVYAGYRKRRDTPEYIHRFIELLAERGRELEDMDQAEVRSPEE